MLMTHLLKVSSRILFQIGCTRYRVCTCEWWCECMIVRWCLNHVSEFYNKYLLTKPTDQLLWIVPRWVGHSCTRDAVWNSVKTQSADNNKTLVYEVEKSLRTDGHFYSFFLLIWSYGYIIVTLFNKTTLVFDSVFFHAPFNCV